MSVEDIAKIDNGSEYFVWSSGTTVPQAIFNAVHKWMEAEGER